MSGRGLPQGVDGQMGQGPIPSSEGYAGAPGKSTLQKARMADCSSLCLLVCSVGPEFHLSGTKFRKVASKGCESSEEPLFAYMTCGYQEHPRTKELFKSVISPGKGENSEVDLTRVQDYSHPGRRKRSVQNLTFYSLCFQATPSHLL